MTLHRKCLLIGLDAATWRVLDPLLQRGRLPHLQRLISRGTSGVLRSFEYSASPVTWTTIATGKMPAKHNIRDFRVSRRDLRAKQVWQILGDRGYRVGMFQYLVTWPPQSVDGFIVPGWLALDSTAYPPHLGFINEFVNRGRFVRRNEVNRLRDYLRFGVQTIRHGLRMPTVASIMGYMLGRAMRRYPSLESRYRVRSIWMRLSTDFFCYLMRHYRPDFAAIIFYQTDSIGHYFWKFREPNLFRNVNPLDVGRYGDMIDKIYCQADATIGRILKQVGDGCTVFVLSDHGMGPAIHESGLLWRPRIEVLLESLGMKWQGGRHAVIGLDFHIRVDGDQPGTLVSDYHLFKSFIEGIRLQDTREQVFEVQLLPDGVASVRVKTARQELPGSSVVLPNGEVRTYESLVNIEEDISGAHQPEGVFIISGPHIKRGMRIQEANLADMIPTLLALLGLSVAHDMDGKVLVEAIEEDFLRANPVRYIDSYEDTAHRDASDQQPDISPEEEEILEERLRSLGYIN